MSRGHHDIPEIVRNKAAVDGDGGAAWVGTLPALVADLEDAWSIHVGAPLGGGTASFTAHARTPVGAPADLKIAVPDPCFALQVRTLLAARGRGYVALLASDVNRYAVLLEALGPPLDRAALAPEQQLTRPG